MADRRGWQAILETASKVGLTTDREGSALSLQRQRQGSPRALAGEGNGRTICTSIHVKGERDS
jgi:hypothetical protein